MASFTMKGTGTAVASKGKIQRVKDFLEGENYEEAGIQFFGKVFGLDDPDIFALAVREYCDKYKRTGKDGSEYADIGGFSPMWTKRALGALYGDQAFGGLMYTMAQWFDTATRQERLQSIVSALTAKPTAGSKPKRATK